MKQYISIKEAFDTLTKEQYKKLVDWQLEHEYIRQWKEETTDVVAKSQSIFGDFVFMNIGQMIEFIEERGTLIYEPEIHPSDNSKSITLENYKKTVHGIGICLFPYSENKTIWEKEEELCDALWEAVKEVLKSEVSKLQQKKSTKR